MTGIAAIFAHFKNTLIMTAFLAFFARLTKTARNARAKCVLMRADKVNFCEAILRVVRANERG